MDSIPSQPLHPDLAQIGQVVFAADGRARALVLAGRRYAILGDAATQQAIGQVARAANLFINPQTLELFDQARRPLGRAAAPEGGP